MRMFSSNNQDQDTKLVLPEQPITETPKTPPTTKQTVYEVARFSIIALLIVIPIRLFIAQPFIVSGASMADTFHTGEYLIVDQLTYHLEAPARGDVVIFRYPKDPSKFFIKRVIGLPGETVTIEDSNVTITNEAEPNGFILEEPYIKSMRSIGRTEEVLGEREYFVMGDNRDESSDSRAWGVLQEERIVGRAYVRLFPPSMIDILPGQVEDFSQSSH
jgi:signal peptidase I